ncbi:MAG: HEAT repeat domain-containing protein [Pirellulales bacterium]
MILRWSYRVAICTAACLALLATAGGACSADEVVLSGGGQLEGQLADTAKRDPDQVALRTAEGIRVIVPRDQVAKLVRTSAADIEYRQLAPTYPDTVEGQWALAEWCRQQKLRAERHVHLQRVIELDPNHAVARRLLGYQQHAGRWMTQAEIMTERGYVQHNGDWLLPQEIEIAEKKRKDTLAEKQWLATLKRWREWLNDDRRAAEGAAKLRAINDPYAVKAIRQHLKTEQVPQVREWYVEALARIGTPDALSTLVQLALNDPLDDVRLSAVELLVENQQPEVVAMFIQALKSKDNAVINRAAYALGKLGNPAAIPALVDSLVTRHKFMIVQGSQGISTTFGGPTPSGPPPGAGAGFPSTPQMGGFSTGQSSQIVVQQLRNPEVLDALIRMTRINFEYNSAQWKAWLASRKKPESEDVRRD